MIDLENIKIKLYKVSLRGFIDQPMIRTSFVIANDPHQAYQRVRKFLDEQDYGFSKDRELDSIQLIAERYFYTNAPACLFIAVEIKDDE